MTKGYVAAFDAIDNASARVFSVSWAAVGGFGIVLAVALRRSRLYSASVARISVASELALMAAMILGIGCHIAAAFVPVGRLTGGSDAI